MKMEIIPISAWASGFQIFGSRKPGFWIPCATMGKLIGITGKAAEPAASGYQGQKGSL